ncbi:MAG TPA: HAD-IC family P-type ATPase, partial [Anaerolineae bacterium]|nr:HAD-IC family P-type ATPase [Anaerolineae bacterium]
AAQARGLNLAEVEGFQAKAGPGAQGRVNGHLIRAGNLRYVDDSITTGLAAAKAELARLQAEGKTAIAISRGEGPAGQLLGVIALADRLRPNAAEIVRDLKSLGVTRVVMLTGDNERVAQAIAKEAGVDEVYAELLPENKVQRVKELQARYGAVAMVGDGVNDAPALASATIGMAMGAAGTDVALETADVVLMSDDLSNIAYVIALSRQTRKTLMVNLGFALAAIVIMIAAIFTANFPLPLAVVGHEGGTVLVSLNGLRLLLFKR